MTSNATRTEPFLKWAGGKRWLVRQCSNLFPTTFGRYIEPFVGSGAVFFYLDPKRAILADKNAELIAAYRTIRAYPKEVETLLDTYHKRHNPSFYYSIRLSNPSAAVQRAVRFIYLNRVCWNGLYRVNLKGQFNVPLGTKNQVKFDAGFLEVIAKRLGRVRLLISDFEPILDLAGPRDFVYIDPPYTVSHNNNGFIKYNDVLFSWADQIRLARAVRKASERGALVFVSNANHDAVVDLYKGFTFHRTLTRCSILSGKADGRRRTEEVALINYVPV